MTIHRDQLYGAHTDRGSANRAWVANLHRGRRNQSCRACMNVSIRQSCTRSLERQPRFLDLLDLFSLTNFREKTGLPILKLLDFPNGRVSRMRIIQIVFGDVKRGGAVVQYLLGDDVIFIELLVTLIVG